jgi:hypothetical protein
VTRAYAPRPVTATVTGMTTPALPFTVAVVGVSFHADVVATLNVGQRVLVSHDPANPYDENACAVTADGELVGHLPRTLAARMVSGGDSAWDGQVDELIHGDFPTAVRVTLTGVHGAWAATVTPVTSEDNAQDLADTDSAPENPPGVLAAQLVRARSGRELGTLAGIEGGIVLVNTGESVRKYPRELVDIGQA